MTQTTETVELSEKLWKAIKQDRHFENVTKVALLIKNWPNGPPHTIDVFDNAGMILWEEYSDSIELLVKCGIIERFGGKLRWLGCPFL